jgi:ubiquinone biosynthesis protein Coq4
MIFSFQPHIKLKYYDDGFLYNHQNSKPIENTVKWPIFKHFGQQIDIYHLLTGKAVTNTPEACYTWLEIYECHGSKAV